MAGTGKAGCHGVRPTATNSGPRLAAACFASPADAYDCTFDTSQNSRPAVSRRGCLRTTQVLSNLLVNAAKYTDRGGRIELSARAERNTVCIEVKDNGIGLAPESLSEIFQVFGQVKKSADRSVGGLGIGLTLARRLVELQGGTLEAHSPGLGSGSTFRVVLPVAEGMQPLHAV